MKKLIGSALVSLLLLAGCADEGSHGNRSTRASGYEAALIAESNQAFEAERKHEAEAAAEPNDGDASANAAETAATLNR